MPFSLLWKGDTRVLVLEGLNGRMKEDLREQKKVKRIYDAQK